MTRAMRETKQTKENLRQTMTEVKRAGETRNLFRSIYYKLYKATLEVWVELRRTPSRSQSAAKRSHRKVGGGIPMHHDDFRCVPTISLSNAVVP